MSTERWRAVIGFEGLYEVSDAGRVISLISGRRLLRAQTSNGYSRVVLYKDGESRILSVHHLVHDAFVGSDRTGLTIDHIDRDKNNNTLENLRLVSDEQNRSNGGKASKAVEGRVVGATDAWLYFKSAKSAAKHLGRINRSAGSNIICAANGGLTKRGKWVTQSIAYGWEWRWPINSEGHN